MFGSRMSSSRNSVLHKTSHEYTDPLPQLQLPLNEPMMTMANQVFESTRVTSHLLKTPS